MRKRTVLAAALGVAVILVASGLMASNMGFKLNYLLEADDAGVTSATGTNTLALPYNQQTSLTSAANVFADINLTVTGAATSISRLIRSTDTVTVRFRERFMYCRNQSSATTGTTPLRGHKAGFFLDVSSVPGTFRRVTAPV